MKNYLIIFLLVILFNNKSFSQDNLKIQSNSQNIIPDISDSFNNANSLNKLNRSQFKNDFYQLINFFR